jgi:hypothetical protein
VRTGPGPTGCGWPLRPSRSNCLPRVVVLSSTSSSHGESKTAPGSSKQQSYCWPESRYPGLRGFPAYRRQFGVANSRLEPVSDCRRQRRGRGHRCAEHPGLEGVQQLWGLQISRDFLPPTMLVGGSLGFIVTAWRALSCGS